LQELKANKICNRGVFGTAKNNGKWFSNIFDINFKNVANTHVLKFGDDELYALWEAGMPFRMDPVTLETIGESTLWGTLDSKPQRYAAHYKVDQVSGNICGFAVRPGKDDPANTHILDIMEHSTTALDERDRLVYKESYDMDRVGVAHDTAITENYFIFLSCPFTFKPIPLLLGLKSASQCIEWDPDVGSSTLILVPRKHKAKSGQEPILIDIPPAFSFHTANAFEEDDGTVVVDIVVGRTTTEGLAGGTDGRYPEQPMWETINWATDVPANDLKRIRVDPSTASYVSSQVMSEGCATVEFPIVRPSRVGRSYKYAYCACSASETTTTPLQGLVKIDVETGKMLEKWLPEPQQYLSEVSFCIKKRVDESLVAEDDGYLVGYLVDGKNQKSTLVVFDAANPSKGPIAQSELKGWSVNHSLHGTFVPDYAPDLTEACKAAFGN